MNGVTQGAPISGAQLGGIMIGFLAWFVILIIAEWKIFNKMGEPGWKALIPFYSNYVLFDHIWEGIYGLLAAIFVGLGAGLANNAQDGNTMLLVISSVASLIGLVLSQVGNYKLSKAFGKGIGFFFLLFFLNSIGMLILGFGSSKYLGNPSKE